MATTRLAMATARTPTPRAAVRRAVTRRCTCLRARNVTRATLLATEVGVAESFGGRLLGLMGRSALASGEGLWLRPASSIHMLFMRFPIDALFLARPDHDGSRRVVALRAGLRPWTGVVWWARGADGCLELPAGAAAEARTSVGDRVILEDVEPAG